LAGSAEAPPVLLPALVEFFRVLLEDEGAALDLRKLFESFLFRLLLLTELPRAFGGEFSGPIMPLVMVPPPVADILEYAPLLWAECLCNFLPCLILLILV
jgi:hypothetical protein